MYLKKIKHFFYVGLFLSILTSLSLAESLPKFSLETIQSETINSDQFSGKILLVDFFATWCPPCIASIPHLTDLQKKYQTNGFQMLGISVDENPKEILPAFIEKMGINYPVALSSPSVIDGFGGVEYLPTAFLINQEGQIVKKFVGYVEPQVIQAEIEKLL